MQQLDGALAGVDSALREAYDEWELDATNNGGVVGQEVVANLKREQHFLDVRYFTEFLEYVAQSHAGGLSCEAAYRGACYAESSMPSTKHGEYQQRGRVSEVDKDTHLFRLMCSEGDFRLVVQQAYGGRSTTADEALSYYKMEATDEERMEILRQAPMSFAPHQLFGTFDPATGHRGGKTDPLQDLTKPVACARLGLRPEWSGYGPDDKLWKVRYLPPSLVERHIPTVADADWRRQFRPSPEPDAPWGLTRPVTVTADSSLEPLPEIVHDNGRGWYLSLPEELP